MAAEVLERPTLTEQLSIERLVDHFPFLQRDLGNVAVILVRADGKTGSFKWRGAENAISQLPAGTDEVATVSAGNHGLGVSRAAALYGLRANIVVPQTAPEQKVDKLHDVWQESSGLPGGLQVIRYGNTFDEAQRYAMLAYPDTPYIHPYDDPVVIAGQGTLVDDVRHAIPGVTDVVLPVGGGGLLTGMHLNSHGVRVYGVEAKGSNSLSRSLAVGRVVEAVHPNERYGGSAVRKTGRHVLSLLQQTGFTRDQLVTADDREVMDLAMHYYYQGEQQGRQLEPTSLVAIAGLAQLARHGAFSDHDTVALVGTGHNESPITWIRRQQQQQKFAGGLVG
jgi:threonine dehydratase